jgi:nucleoside-diphosphate-sugar epimerase
MKVLVTGATSMIGAATVQELLRHGHDVRVLQRGDSPLDVDVIRGDIRDADLVAQAVVECDVVIHAAAKVGLVGRYAEFYDINVAGTKNVIDAAVQAGCRGIVYVSSPSVSYSRTPVNGASAPPATDDVIGHYSKTKSIAERMVLAERRIATVAIRPHLVWGPGDPQLVGRIVERAQHNRLALVNQGEAVVDTTYIDNVADALVAAAERIGVINELGGKALVVSNGEPRTVASLVHSICEAANVPYAPRTIGLRAAVALGVIIETLFKLKPSAEPPLTKFTAYQLGISHWFDISETKQLLQWTPRISLDEGFEELKKWFA